MDPDLENQQNQYAEPARIQLEIIEENQLSTSAEHEKKQDNQGGFEEIQTNQRRSTRIPKMSARALYMLQYDDPNFQDQF